MMKSPSDIIQHNQHARRLRQLAHFDEITGLPSRKLLGDRLRKAIAHSKRWGQLLAVVRLDLDGLEAIYDRHGHDAGDLVLTCLARGMKRTLCKGDTLAHLEGKRFAAVLLDSEDAQASVPALKRLLAAAGERVQVGDSTHRVSASIGVAFYPQDEDADADQLLSPASLAMHQARAAGRNRYQFFDF